MAKILFICLFYFLSTSLVHAAGMIARVQQMKAMRQQAQQQQEEQAYQQEQGQQPTPQSPAPPTYAQQVDQRNQAIAQAILTAQNQTAGSGTLSAGTNTTNTLRSQDAITSSIAQQQSTSSSTNAADNSDEVDLTEVWKKLDKKSTVWTLLMDQDAKVMTVSEYIDRFHKEGVRISEPPLHYVQMIDGLVQQNPQALQQPFGQLIQILAIIDYDFDNGMNKDELARHVLGEAGFEANKKRFTQQ